MAGALSASAELVPRAIDGRASQRGEGSFVPRYEDIAQDGRLSCRAMTHALGVTLWEKVRLAHPFAAPLGDAGILPILSRMSVASVGGPIGYGSALNARGGFSIVRARDEKGRTRFRLDMSAEVEGGRRSSGVC